MIDFKGGDEIQLKARNKLLGQLLISKNKSCFRGDPAKGDLCLVLDVLFERPRESVLHNQGHRSGSVVLLHPKGICRHRFYSCRIDDWRSMIHGYLPLDYCNKKERDWLSNIKLSPEEYKQKKEQQKKFWRQKNYVEQQ